MTQEVSSSGVMSRPVGSIVDGRFNGGSDVVARGIGQLGENMVCANQVDGRLVWRCGQWLASMEVTDKRPSISKS